MASASFDLGDLWRHYCAKAMGLEIDWGSESGSKRRKVQDDGRTKMVSFVSLIPPSSNHSGMDDAWIQTAKQVQKNIDEMSSWIQAKKKSFLSVEMSDQEASLIQSTVTSFCAQTANEIESLHTVISAKDEESQHRLGIVQILMANLKEQVADTFKRLSNQRKRPAIALWQTPLQCRHIHGTPFQPTRQSHRLHLDFWDAYTVRAPLERPVSILARGNSKSTVEESTMPSKPFVADTTSTADQPSAGERFQEQVSTNEAVLQQEAVLLQQVTSNDLDAVQKMEEMMVNITTLISQFASLVSEQQDDVYDIHSNAAEAKQHMTKGQENLADAKERTRSSQHYMAKGILAMAILLLLMHWLRP